MSGNRTATIIRDGEVQAKLVHLERIAGALSVRPEAIADYSVDDVDEATCLLFRLGEDWKLRLVEVVDEHFFLVSRDQDIFNAVRVWGEMLKRLDAGEITELEYVTLWDGYTAKKRVG